METYSVLVVEDCDDLREAIVDTLILAGFSCLQASSAEEAIPLLKSEAIGLVISDIQMSGMNGHELLKHITTYYSFIPVIIITAHATVQSAVEAMQVGAVEYITKPFEPTVLISFVEKYLIVDSPDVTDPVAVDPNSLKVFELARKVAASNATVLITGQSGTGKEILARYIHDHSTRHEKPFIAINCAAIPENMLEATLFGYEKGAYTGAYKSFPGKFEQAQGGTILLDEISEMPLNLQAKLLRVLQEQEVERLGGHEVVKLDVRILATSNRDLIQYVKEGNFREDLYFRLNVFPIKSPSLSERPGDIVPLAEYFLQKYVAEQQGGTIALSPSAQKRLSSYGWPGNVRELENVIQRALVMQSGGVVEESDLHLESLTQHDIIVNTAVPAAQPECTQLDTQLKDQELNIIREALLKSGGRKKDAAEILGISPRTLRHKLAKLKEEGITL